MVNKLEIYKCDICGNIVEIVHAGKGTLVCCGKPMAQLKENTVDASKEKHVPVIEKMEKGYKVTVGSIKHPMEEKHYIEWIQLISGENIYRKFLNPGDEPVAEFETTSKDVIARELCNLHGLWKA